MYYAIGSKSFRNSIQLSGVGNRRYYQRHEVQLIRRIRSLLYIEGFTISGAKNQIETEASGDQNATTPVRKKMVEELIHEIDEVVAILSE